MAPVVSPRALTCSATFHQWFSRGVSSSRTLPTICIHICSVSRVPCQASGGSAGQHDAASETAVLPDSASIMERLRKLQYSRWMRPDVSMLLDLAHLLLQRAEPGDHHHRRAGENEGPAQVP